MTNARATAATKMLATSDSGSGAIRIPWVAKVPMIRRSSTEDTNTIRLGRDDHLSLIHISEPTRPY